jgi:hypothetical protein
MALQDLLDQLKDSAGIAWNEETYDLAIGRTLGEPDRLAYAAALDPLIRAGDGRAALTAGSLGLTTALDALRAKKDEPGSFGLQVRRALVQLGEGASVVDQLVHDLQAPAHMQRFAAAMVLGKAGRPRSKPATEGLIGALGDEELTVRARAFESLLEVLELEPLAQNAAGDDVELRSPLRRLDLLLGSKLQALREPARQELARLARAILGGATPQSLGLVYTPATSDDFRTRLGRSLFVAEAPLPLDEIRALAPESADRKWAESLVAKSLERKVVRAPAVLAQLGATWTVPALREAAEKLEADDPFRVEAEQAIRQLAGGAS